MFRKPKLRAPGGFASCDTVHAAWPRSESSLRAVLSSTGNPVSAKQKLSLPRGRGLTVLCQLLAIALFFVSPASGADSPEELARSLARKVAAGIRGSSATWQTRNLSSLTVSDFSAFSSAFEDELQKLGVKFVAADAALSLSLTVTENPTEYLAVLQIQHRDRTETVIEKIGLMKSAGSPQLASAYTLRRQLLFSQDSPMVDVVLIDDARRAEALGTHEIYHFEFSDAQWLPRGTESLSARGKYARELRGFLSYGLDSRSVRFPGEVCSASTSEGSAWKCRSDSGPWDVRTVTRNTRLEKELPSWFSAAELRPAGKTQTVFTGRDGLARLYEEGPEPVATFPDWGSEIAAIENSCGSGWQLLVTGKSDWTKNDAIRAIEIRQRRAEPVSAPVEVPGPVVALHSPSMWPAQDSAANASALAIVRNLQTGRYEAYRLTLSCSN